MAACIELRNVALKLAVAKFYRVTLCNNAREFIDAENLFHDVNAVGVNHKPNLFVKLGGDSALNFDFISTALYQNLVMNTLEYDGSHFAFKHTFLGGFDLNVLGTNDNIDGLVGFKATV